jgi:cytochrome c556
LCIAALLIVSALGLAQVKKGKTRLLETRQLMSAVVKTHCGGIKKGLEAAPADDKAWAELATSAALLNEASYILMDDGRCPDGAWAEAATKLLRDGSARVHAAVAARDVEGARKAFGEMTKACEACHKAHKK